MELCRLDARAGRNPRLVARKAGGERFPDGTVHCPVPNGAENRVLSAEEVEARNGVPREISVQNRPEPLLSEVEGRPSRRPADGFRTESQERNGAPGRFERHSSNDERRSHDDSGMRFTQDARVVGPAGGAARPSTSGGFPKRPRSASERQHGETAMHMKENPAQPGAVEQTDHGPRGPHERSRTE